MASISASFTYEPGEYARALRRVQMRRHRARFDSLVAIVLLGSGAYLWSTAGFSLWAAVLCSLAALFLAMLAFAVLVVPHLVERSQAKFRQPYALSFTADGIHFRTPTIDSQVPWSLYHSWSEDEDYLYLFHGKRDVTVLPIRALATAADHSALRDLVSHRIVASCSCLIIA